MILLVEEVLHLRYIHPDIERRCALTWGMMWKQSELQKIRKKSWGIWMFPKIVGFPPKSSILIGFSTINHPFWDTPIFGSTHIVKFYLLPDLSTIQFLAFLERNHGSFFEDSQINKLPGTDQFTRFYHPQRVMEFQRYFHRCQMGKMILKFNLWVFHWKNVGSGNLFFPSSTLALILKIIGYPPLELT